MDDEIKKAVKRLQKKEFQARDTISWLMAENNQLKSELSNTYGIIQKLGDEINIKVQQINTRIITLESKVATNTIKV